MLDMNILWQSLRVKMSVERLRQYVNYSFIFKFSGFGARFNCLLLIAH